MGIFLSYPMGPVALMLRPFESVVRFVKYWFNVKWGGPGGWCGCSTELPFGNLYLDGGYCLSSGSGDVGLMRNV